MSILLDVPSSNSG
uniref:Uncharacterized protein n=1 Tax=Lepeophtheirus salmonis TaxID=72036 RepID=A0A0K2UIF6_LEPSM